jgi:hypothetical protein
MTLRSKISVNKSWINLSVSPAQKISDSGDPQRTYYCAQFRYDRFLNDHSVSTETGLSDNSLSSV